MINSKTTDALNEWPFAAVGMLNRFNAFCSESSDSTTSVCLGIMVPL